MEQEKNYIKKPVVVKAYRTNDRMIIHTLEGDMIAEPGDYIVTGIRGEKYPCKPDIFNETYELI
nr:MAG TPA: PGDYG protein [Bacteriophage sp.]